MVSLMVKVRSRPLIFDHSRAQFWVSKLEKYFEYSLSLTRFSCKNGIKKNRFSIKT